MNVKEKNRKKVVKRRVRGIENKSELSTRYNRYNLFQFNELMLQNHRFGPVWLSKLRDMPDMIVQNFEPNRSFVKPKPIYRYFHVEIN